MILYSREENKVQVNKRIATRLIHTEVEGPLVVASVEVRYPSGLREVHTLVCMDSALTEPSEVDAYFGTHSVLVPVLYSVLPKFHDGLEFFVGEAKSADTANRESNGGINLREYLDLCIGSAMAMVRQCPGMGSLGMSTAAVPIREALATGVIRAWGYRLFGERPAPKNLFHRIPVYHALERFFALFGIENNIKVYAAGFGFSHPKASKDVRTYRQTVAEMEENSSNG
jgi:hypothetical protein